MADGKLIFDTGLDDSGVTSDLGALKGTFQSAFAKIGSVIGAALVIDKVKDFVVQSISLASDLAEVQNVVDVTFGNSADTINDWAKKASEAYGLTELQAKQYTSTMGAMLKSSGLSGDAIVSMSEDLAGLTADFASFYNLDHEDAFEKIRSGISGETEPLKQLGINMSVANLEAYALSEGITKSYNSMTQAEQTTLRYNYLMSVTADAQGDFARTSDGYANQIRSLSNNVTDLSASFGAKLLPSVNDVVKALNDELTSDKAADAMEALGDAAANATEKVGKMAILIIQNGDKIAATGKAIGTAFILTKAVGNINNLMTSVKKASTVVDTFIVANDLMKISTATAAKGMTTLQLAVGVLTGKVTLAAAAQTALNVTILANPYVAIIAAIGIAITTLAVFCNSLDDAKTKTDEINGAINENATNIEESAAAYQDLINAQNKAMETGVGEINHYQSLKKELDGIVDANGRVKEGYESRAAFIAGELSDATGTEISLIDGVIQGYNNLSATIDAYLEKRKAQLIVEAQEDAYKAAISNLDIYLQESSDAFQNLLAARENYNDLMSQTINKNNYQQLTADREAAAKTVSTAEEKWNKAKELANDALSTINQYENDSANLTQGNIEAVIAAHNQFIDSLINVSTATQEQLEAQKTTIEEKMAAMKQIYEDTGNEQVQTIIEDLQEQLDATNSALDAMKTTVEEKTPEHAEIWKKLGYESYDAYCVAVRSGKTAANQAGEEVASSGVAGAGSQKPGFAAAGADGSLNISSGILSKSGTVSGSAKSVAEAARAAAASVDTTPAGASFASGIASGISSGLSKLKNAAISVVMAAYNAAKRWLDSHSPSKKTAKGLGVPWTQGVGVGIESETPKLMSTAKVAMQRAVAAARSAINEAQISTSLSIMPAVVSSGSGSAGNTNTIYQTMYFGNEQSSPSDVKREARRGAKQGLAGGTA